jgi:hypothetical protein
MLNSTTDVATRPEKRQFRSRRELNFTSTYNNLHASRCSPARWRLAQGPLPTTRARGPGRVAAARLALGGDAPDRGRARGRARRALALRRRALRLARRLQPRPALLAHGGALPALARRGLARRARRSAPLARFTGVLAFLWACALQQLYFAQGEIFAYLQFVKLRGAVEVTRGSSATRSTSRPVTLRSSGSSSASGGRTCSRTGRQTTAPSGGSRAPSFSPSPVGLPAAPPWRPRSRTRRRSPTPQRSPAARGSDAGSAAMLAGATALDIFSPRRHPSSTKLRSSRPRQPPVELRWSLRCGFRRARWASPQRPMRWRIGRRVRP